MAVLLALTLSAESRERGIVKDEALPRATEVWSVQNLRYKTPLTSESLSELWSVQNMQ